jgi:hypothetical protein
MSTARNLSVLMHNSSNAGGATLIANVAEEAMARFAFHSFSDGLKILQKFETCRGVKSSAMLHLEADITALRVSALAGEFGRFFRIGTRIAAVSFSRRSDAVAGGVFALFCGGHESSFELNVLSLF